MQVKFILLVVLCLCATLTVQSKKASNDDEFSEFQLDDDQVTKQEKSERVVVKENENTNDKEFDIEITDNEEDEVINQKTDNYKKTNEAPSAKANKFAESALDSDEFESFIDEEEFESTIIDTSTAFGFLLH
jgi:hypothetical protein